MSRMRIPPRKRVRVDTMQERSLVDQLEHLAQTSNRGFVETRKTAFYKYRTFLLFVADRFNVADIRLIEPRHVAAFVDAELGRGVRPETILPELSSIRF